VTGIGPYLELALEEAVNNEGGTNPVSTHTVFPALASVGDEDKMMPLEQLSLIQGMMARMPHLGAGKYEPEVKLGKLHVKPDVLGFLLAWAMGNVVTVPGDGALVVDPDAVPVPIGCYMHTFTFANATEPRTARMQMCSGDGVHRKGTGFGASELAFTWETDGAMLAEVTTLGCYLADQADPSVVPVIDMVPPFRRGDMVLSWLDGTALTREFDFAIKSPVEQIFSPVYSSLFPTDIWYKNGAADLPAIDGTIAKATIAAADWAALLAGTQFNATVKIVHRVPIGETEYVPKVWVQVPGCQLLTVARDAIQAERRREGKWTWESRYAPASGLYASVVLVNGVSSYTTWAS
jgi:hypothetical protein